MHSKRAIAILVVCILFTSVFLYAKQISAVEEIEYIVNTDFHIELVSATDFNIDVFMDVQKATAFGISYDQNEIKSLTTSMNVDDIEALGVIKNNLHTSLFNQIESIFENAEYNMFNNKPTYIDNKFYEKYSINLTSSYFGINKTVNIYDFINGLLDMGAVLNYDFKLRSEAGWNNTFKFELENNFGLKRTNGDYNHVENTVRWDVRNWTGSNETTSAELLIKDKNPTMHANKEDIFLEFTLDSTDGYTSLETDIIAKTIDISYYNVIPSCITNLTYISSDGIRLLVNQDLITWDELYQKTIKTIEDKIKSTVETPLFNQTLLIAFNWDDETTINTSMPYDVEKMDDEPPVIAVLRDEDINLKIFDISARGLFGLINTGAASTVTENDINFGNNLGAIGYPYNISLILPEDIKLKKQNVYTWNNTILFNGTFESDKKPDYKNEDINTIIEFEVKNTDLNLFSFFTGETELSFGMDITEIHDYNVTTLPNSLILPDQIKINFLNSDAIRLCFEETIFSEEMKNIFLENEKIVFEEGIEDILNLKISGSIDRDVFTNSLTWDGDIGEMDANNPVKTSLYSYTNYPVKFDTTIILPSFEIRNQKFTFSGMDGHTVTYRMFFPNGISINANDGYGKTDVKKTKDGNQYIELIFEQSESNLTVDVTCSMTPSLLFILGVFVPCFIAFFILIILIVVVVIIRRKRKRGKPIVIKEEESSQEHENEDYYVPPPPGSK